MEKTLRDRAESLAVSLEGHARGVMIGQATEERTAALLALAGATIRLLLPLRALAEDKDEDEAPTARKPAKTKPPANACTDGKRHKYGEDRKCGKCGAADPRAKAPPAAPEIPGVA